MEISVDHPLLLATRPNIWNEQRRVLEWLLIDVWRASGVVNWLEPLIQMTNSNRKTEASWHLDISE